MAPVHRAHLYRFNTGSPHRSMPHVTAAEGRHHHHGGRFHVRGRRVRVPRLYVARGDLHPRRGFWLAARRPAGEEVADAIGRVGKPRRDTGEEIQVKFLN